MAVPPSWEVLSSFIKSFPSLSLSFSTVIMEVGEVGLSDSLGTSSFKDQGKVYDLDPPWMNPERI